MSPERLPELEEVLVYPGIEMVVVADDLRHRGLILRRAVQSEKHVFCVHPCDTDPHIAYEVAVMQMDTRKLLLPILLDRFTAGMTRLMERCRDGEIGELEAVEFHVGIAEPSSAEGQPDGLLPLIWDPLRCVGGEIGEVLALPTAGGELTWSSPATLTGRYTDGGAIQVMLMPRRGSEPDRLSVRGRRGRAELAFRLGAPAVQRLRVATDSGESHEEFETWDPWSKLAAELTRTGPDRHPRLDWFDEIRALELCEAAQRSARRRRVVAVQYEDLSAASETAGFKTVMTMLGCGVLTLALVLLVAMLAFGIPLASWFPLLVLPFLILFLLLQLLRWIIPESEAKDNRRDHHAEVS